MNPDALDYVLAVIENSNELTEDDLAVLAYAITCLGAAKAGAVNLDGVSSQLQRIERLVSNNYITEKKSPIGVCRNSAKTLDFPPIGVNIGLIETRSARHRNCPRRESAGKIFKENPCNKRTQRI